MKLDEAITLMQTYGRAHTFILWSNDEVEKVFNSQQEFINTLTTLDISHKGTIWGVTISDNLVEVMLDAPKIR